MSSIRSIHSDTLNLFQDLMLSKKETKKQCVLSYPKDAIHSKYRNKQFIIECIISKVEQGRMKNNSRIYTSDALKVTLLYSDIADTKDMTGILQCPEGNFKTNNVVIKYSGRKYIIEEESMGSFENSVSLICEVKS